MSEWQSRFETKRIGSLLERGFLLSQAVNSWQERAIWVVSRADEEYPQRLKERLGANAPTVLYGCGNRELLENGGLAVVGSRNTSEELLEYTESIGRLAARSGCAIISGGGERSRPSGNARSANSGRYGSRSTDQRFVPRVSEPASTAMR